MKKWANTHKYLIGIAGVLASAMAFAFTTFATQKQLDDKAAEIKSDRNEIKDTLVIMQADIKELLQRTAKRR